MIFYSLQEMLWIVLAALVIDFAVGDPKRPVHPVIHIGRLVRLLESRLRKAADTARTSRLKGAALALTTTCCAFLVIWAFAEGARFIHPWLGYAVHAWFLSTTIAVRGLGAAAIAVYRPLAAGDLSVAREKVGQIVGRDTTQASEKEIVRAAVETVAENTVDAVVAPLFFGLLGAAPLAMFYRAANTLDSMVGYKNEKYVHFGWASARLDDLWNWVPARITGILMPLVVFLQRGPSAALRAIRAIVVFARRHPSPNGGIPESAAAGALGVELGGTNRYGDVVSDRAKLGWPFRELHRKDIVRIVKLLYGVAVMIGGGLLCVAWAIS